MIVKRFFVAMVGLIALCFVGDARAQPQPMSGMSPAPVAATASRARLGLVLAPMPVGKIKLMSGALTISDDTAFAFGIVPTFDYSVSEYFFVGLAPQFILNVKGKSGADEAQELDLRARGGANARVADTVRLFGYIAPGYSIIMVPNKPAGTDNPSGLVLGVAGGALIDLTPTVFFSAEVGYQFGFQGITFMGASADFTTNYLHIGVGLGVRL